MKTEIKNIQAAQKKFLDSLTDDQLDAAVRRGCRIYANRIGKDGIEYWISPGGPDDRAMHEGWPGSAVYAEYSAWENVEDEDEPSAEDIRKSIEDALEGLDVDLE